MFETALLFLIWVLVISVSLVILLALVNTWVDVWRELRRKDDDSDRKFPGSLS